MSLFDKTLSYFKALSLIPRKSHNEEKVRKWLISWAESHNWEYEEDAIGNLLIRAKSTNPERLCLQSHMDMVCVSREPHDWETEGVTVIEENAILKGDWTTLGADNGIGVAVMMALAELEERPTLELLFTMGEEVGLIGTHHLQFPITAAYGINLDWCDSTSIGIWCGGTLLMEWEYKVQSIKYKVQSNWIYILQISGMRGGHSGVDIGENRGNALIELAQLLIERDDFEALAEFHGGDADNAIPRNAQVKVLFSGDEKELENWIEKKTHQLQKKTENPKAQITLEKTEHSGDFYEKTILNTFIRLWSGVQRAWNWIPLSSWNLGKMNFSDGILHWCYFLRTNIPWGVAPLKDTIQSSFKELQKLNQHHKVSWSLSHESPVWLVESESPFVKKILETINNPPFWSLSATADELWTRRTVSAVGTHATIEVSTLAEKYPKTEWVSVGATCHDMHTTREHIHLCDLEEFCERMKRIITRM